MKRRSRAGGEPIKGPRRKTPEPKRRNATKVAARPNSSPTTEKTEVARLTRENAGLLSEVREYLQQRTATAEVLSIISRSTFDLAKVLNTVLELGARLSKADKGVILRAAGNASYYAAATYRHTPEFIESQKGILFAPGRSGVVGRVLLESKSVQVADVFDDPEYAYRKFAMRGGFRTILGVPLVREGSVIGLFVLHRAAVRPFTDKQIKLVETFADQAVIAIENARLLNELRQRTSDLTESLEQQTATSEVLQVISKSPGELEPVFARMLENAVRICDATFGNIYRWNGDFHILASHNTPPALADARRRTRQPFEVDERDPLGRMVLTKRIVHVADLAAERGYLDRIAFGAVQGVELGGIRTTLMVPMLKDEELVGAFILSRQKVHPFTDKQIELIENFASQAVIAIENARLLNELRQRTTDLSEALEQQTATSDVLQVISSSPGELEPVFATMLQKAVRICDANFGNIYRWDGETGHLIATYNTPSAFAEHLRRFPHYRPNPKVGIGRMFATKEMVSVADVRAEASYVERRDPSYVAAVELGGVRSYIAVPMLKEGELIGGFTLSRHDVRPFNDKQIDLVKNFAAQAVIAIENARLLNELRQRTTDLTEALEQQTGTSEVLQVISRSPGELEPIFDTILENATRICEANFGVVQVLEGDGLRAVSFHDVPAVYAEAMRRDPVFRPIAEHPLHRVASTKQVVHVADVRDEQGLRGRIVELAGARTLLCVPMLKDNTLVGVISIYRQEVRPFMDKQIALVQNFAAQAVIAIENARLLSELRQRTTDLTEALEQQTATSDLLRIISSSPGDLKAVFDKMLENATRICDAKFGTIDLQEGGGLRLVAAHGVPPAFAAVRGKETFHPAPDGILDTTMKTARTVHIPNLAATQSYIERHPRMVEAVEVAGIRTAVGVPMLKDGELIGIVAVFRQEVSPFTDKQIELLSNFAAQAVIAIENARLLKELRERTEQVETQAHELRKLNQHLEQRVTDQVDEIERMGRLRRFLPPQVADLIVASGTEKQLESHRREITALFCDLRGFTGFSESADPEDVMTVLREYHEALGASIIRYSGTLERYAGDGVMVVFNDPVPVENPALQAVLMALEMREAIGALTETWRRWGHDIGFGIGIAHGFATLGTIGFEGRFDYAAIGTVSNVASRLCDEAKPGQILISPRVLTKVENAVTVEPVGEFELKGIRRPLAAYNVVGAQSSEK